MYTHGVEAPADWVNLRSAETYWRGAVGGFASPEGASSDERAGLVLLSRLFTNQWALEGTWTFRSEDALLNEAPGRIVYRFHARDLHLIRVPPSQNVAARFRVRLDGRPPLDADGLDIDRRGQWHRHRGRGCTN